MGRRFGHFFFQGAPNVSRRLLLLEQGTCLSAKGRRRQASPLGTTLPVPLASPSRFPSPLRGRLAGALGADRCARPLTPVMTAASPAGGVSSSGGSSSRSSSGAQCGLLMAPSGLAAVGGCWERGAGALAGARSGGLAGGYREPPGGYKGKRGRDSRPRPPGSPRGGHCAGTPPRSHALPPGPAGFRDDQCRRSAPCAPASGATQAAPPARLPAPRAILWASFAAAAFRTRRNRLCRLTHTHLLSWFPKLHVLSADNLQLICSTDV